MCHALQPLLRHRVLGTGQVRSRRWLVEPLAHPLPVQKLWGVGRVTAAKLHERGVFTWSEWAATLSDEIKRAQAAGDPDTGETYYRHWLATLERLVAEKGVATRDTLHRYRDAWDRACDRTPHGKPIELESRDFA